MRFNIANLYIHPIAQQCLGFLQHPESFTDTGTHADVDLKLPAPRFADEVDEMGRIFFLFRHVTSDCPGRDSVSEHSHGLFRIIRIAVFRQTVEPWHLFFLHLFPWRWQFSVSEYTHPR